jgi:hypothetical protein
MRGREIIMRKRYPIEIDNELIRTVYYPADLRAKLEKTESIAFGNRSCSAKFLAHPQKKNILVLSSDIAEELFFLNLNIPLHLFHENNTLYLGPLVGICTSGFTPSTLKPIGDRSEFFSKLLSVQKSVGAIPFVFGERHIDWELGLIEGYLFYQNSWKRHRLPFPNVVYDRLPNRRSETRREQQLVKERMQQEYLIPWYNPGFFNKMDIYEKLYNDYQAYTYLPETTPFTSFSHIEGMLSDYGHVYIKPINGSLGLGVHQIILDKMERLYYCRYYDNQGIKRLQKFSSLERLFNHVFRHRPLKNMLVQQGITLLKYDNRPIDFRVHTNKDEHGNWKVTAVAAKIAGTGSVTTHVKNGGEIRTLDEIFSKEDRDIYISKLREAALKLSDALEKQMDGIMAEIGFDLGIDKHGRVWLFEANSKPGRSIFTHPNLRDFDWLTRKLSIGYAVFLTEKSIHSPEELFK